MGKKIKKRVIGIMSFLLMLPIKVFADIEYVQTEPALYGPPEPESHEIITRIIPFLIIPIVVLIGLIIYCKKSTDSKKDKIIVITIISIIVIILFFAIIHDYLMIS